MPDNVENCSIHQVHSFKLENHEERLNKIDVILDKVRNRPPIWVTVVIGVLLALLGFLAKGGAP